jgi:ribosomal protein L7/L12
MAKISTADLLDAFKEMTLIELSEFVKQFEDTFDVKAAAPAARPRLRWKSRTSSMSYSRPLATRRSR